MKLVYWTCKCGRRSTANVPTCRGCGAGKPNFRLNEKGEIEIRRKAPVPKREPITAKPTSKFEGSAQDRQSRGEGFCESFMDRARRKDK